MRGRNRDKDRVSVWDVATGRPVTPLVADGPIGAGSAAFAPDGRILATASGNGVLRLWEVATWTVRAELRGHRDSRFVTRRRRSCVGGVFDRSAVIQTVTPRVAPG